MNDKLMIIITFLGSFLMVVIGFFGVIAYDTYFNPLIISDFLLFFAILGLGDLVDHVKR